MKKVISGLTAFAFVGLACAASVHAAESTVMGKLKDVKCASDGKSEPEGADGDACATACAKRGETMAVIAKDGMYVITGKYAENKNEMMIPFIGKELAVKGNVTEKDGKKMIEVTSISEVKK